MAFQDVNIRLWCKRDQEIGNSKREEEKKLTNAQATRRLEWIDIQFVLRPHSVNWLLYAYYDEFHFGIQQEDTTYIERPTGRDYRTRAMNVQLKKGTISKDEKAKAREEGHLPLVNIFVIVGLILRRGYSTRSITM